MRGDVREVEESSHHWVVHKVQVGNKHGEGQWCRKWSEPADKAGVSCQQASFRLQMVKETAKIGPGELAEAPSVLLWQRCKQAGVADGLGVRNQSPSPRRVEKSKSPRRQLDMDDDCC